jgi:isoquinoline 1-oxidoreductase beta subunit
MSAAMEAIDMTRRTLLKTAALVIGFEIPAAAKAVPEKPRVNPLQAWIKIDGSGKATLAYSKSEMGQGVSTSLPMILAEELDIDWKDVRVEHAPLDAAHAGQGTGGSGSVAGMFTPLRQAGAAARQMLVAAAAERWGVGAETCTTKNGAVWHGTDKLSYTELLERASQLPVPDLATVALKKPEDFKIIGTSLPRTDVPEKTDGSAIFGLDVRLPGMVYAVVARCPVFGGKLKSFDGAKAKAMKGVLDIFAIEPVEEAHSCGGVAVVAETTYIAFEARKQLQIEWDFGPAATESSETLRKQFRRIVDSPMKVILDQNNAEDAISKAPAEKKIECDYELPFEAHATMEPMNCTVHVTSDGAEAWAPTQGP